MKQNTKNILRWLFLLPLVFIFGLLTDFSVHFILYSALSGGNEPFITPYPETPELIISPFFRAIAFVYSAFKIAPKFKCKVSIIFSILWILLALSLYIYVNNSHESKPSIIPVISGIIGVILVLFYIFKKRQKEY